VERSKRIRIITDPPHLKSPLQKVGWFVALWFGGVITIGGGATALRFMLHAK
jgi:hypothetical protein